MNVMRFAVLAAATLALLGFADSAFAQACGGIGGDPCPVPEPTTLSLLALGAGALVISKFRKRK